MNHRERLRSPLRRRRAAALLLTSALLACGGQSPAEDAVSASVTVRTEVLRSQDFVEIIGAIGEVAARPGHVAALSAPAPTRVMSVLAAPGSRVAKGDTLVLLEAAVFVSAERGARAAAEAARQNSDRTRRLVDAGILPRRDLEQATSVLAAAEADLVVASRSVELNAVRAPFDGVVTKIAAVLGAAVDAGVVLVEVADPSAVDVVLSVPAATASRLRVGALVSLRTGEGGDSDTIGRGSISEVGGVVDPDTRSVAVRVSVAAARRALRIGETLFGEVTVATVRGALVVPVDALVPEGEGFNVFVVDDKEVAHAREVTVGARRGGLALVLGGIAAGDRVVTSGAYGLTDGAKVVAPRP